MKHLNLGWLFLLLACQADPPSATTSLPSTEAALPLQQYPLPTLTEPDPVTATPFTLFHPQRLMPSNAQQAMAFSPLAQLSYVGYLSTPTQAWALIHSPYGTYSISEGGHLGLQGWQLDHISPKALNLSLPNADTRQLPLTATPSALASQDKP